MTDPQRRLIRRARQLADQQDGKLLDRLLGLLGLGLGTVTTVTAGGASDGNALVYVTYAGTETPASGYLNTYTPTVNDWVLFVRVAHQNIVLGKVIGSP